MTVKRFLQGLIVSVALCLIATVGKAQNSLLYVTGGGNKISDARSFDEAFIPYQSTFAAGGGGNVGFELPLKKSNIFGVEVSYGLSQNNLELTYENSPTLPVTTSYGLRDNRFSGDLVVHSPSTFRNIRPYFVVGAEYDRFSPTSAAVALGNRVGFAYAPVAKLSSQGDAGVNIGGGLDYNLTEKWGVRIDVRDHITGSPTLGLPYGVTPSSNAYFPISGDAHSIQYTIGIVYHFGWGKSSSSAAKPTSPSRQPSAAKAAKEKSPENEKPAPTSVFN
jgi:opacity protein-like surface antigen